MPSIRPPNAPFNNDARLGFFVFPGPGRGDVTRAGGVCAWACGDSGGGTGGVGAGGVAAGAALGTLAPSIKSVYQKLTKVGCHTFWSCTPR